MNDKPVWFLDIDGVINSDRRRPAPWKNVGRWERTQVFTPSLENRGPWEVNYSNEVVKFINKMSAVVDIVWLTSWAHEADASLAPALRLPDGLPLGFDMAKVDSSLLDFGMVWRAKNLSIHTLLKEGDMSLPEDERVPFKNRKVIWTDDEITSETVDDLLLHVNVQPLCVSPFENECLLPSHLEAILDYVNGDPTVPVFLGKNLRYKYALPTAQ